MTYRVYRVSSTPFGRRLSARTKSSFPCSPSPVYPTIQTGFPSSEPLAVSKDRTTHGEQMMFTALHKPARLVANCAAPVPPADCPVSTTRSGSPLYSVITLRVSASTRASSSRPQPVRCCAHASPSEVSAHRQASAPPGQPARQAQPASHPASRAFSNSCILLFLIS